MIHFRCPNCSKKVSVADEHAGKRGKCPQCQQVVIIPRLSRKEPNPQLEALVGQGQGYEVDDPTKPCPYCGEKILDAASKCKHCGEWLGAERMVREASAPPHPQQPNPAQPVYVEQPQVNQVQGSTVLLAYASVTFIPFLAVVWFIYFAIKGKWLDAMGIVIWAFIGCWVVYGMLGELAMRF